MILPKRTIILLIFIVILFIGGILMLLSRNSDKSIETQDSITTTPPPQELSLDTEAIRGALSAEYGSPIRNFKIAKSINNWYLAKFKSTDPEIPYTMYYLAHGVSNNEITVYNPYQLDTNQKKQLNIPISILEEIPESIY